MPVWPKVTAQNPSLVGQAIPCSSGRNSKAEVLGERLLELAVTASSDLPAVKLLLRADLIDDLTPVDTLSAVTNPAGLVVTDSTGALARKLTPTGWGLSNLLASVPAGRVPYADVTGAVTSNAGLTFDGATPRLKVGTTATFDVRLGFGGNSATTGFTGRDVNAIGMTIGGFRRFDFSSSALLIHNDLSLGWSADPGITLANVGIARHSEGTVRVTNGSTGVGNLITGNLTVRQPLGTAGTDQLELSHDGSLASLSDRNAAKGRFLFTGTGGDCILMFGGTGTQPALRPNGQILQAMRANESDNAPVTASEFRVTYTSNLGGWVAGNDPATALTLGFTRFDDNTVEVTNGVRTASGGALRGVNAARLTLIGNGVTNEGRLVLAGSVAAPTTPPFIDFANNSGGGINRIASLSNDSSNQNYIGLRPGLMDVLAAWRYDGSNQGVQIGAGALTDASPNRATLGVVSPTNSTLPTVIVAGRTGQTQPLTEWRGTIGGAAVASVSTAGAVSASSLTASLVTTPDGNARMTSGTAEEAVLRATAAHPSWRAAVFYGATGQTAPITEWKATVGGAVVASVSAAGLGSFEGLSAASFLEVRGPNNYRWEANGVDFRLRNLSSGVTVLTAGGVSGGLTANNRLVVGTTSTSANGTNPAMILVPNADGGIYVSNNLADSTSTGAAIRSILANSNRFPFFGQLLGPTIFSLDSGNGFVNKVSHRGSGSVGSGGFFADSLCNGAGVTYPNSFSYHSYLYLQSGATVTNHVGYGAGGQFVTGANNTATNVYDFLTSNYTGGNLSGQAITNRFGLYLGHTKAGGNSTNAWGVYQLSADVENYFGGVVRAVGGIAAGVTAANNPFSTFWGNSAGNPAVFARASGLSGNLVGYGWMNQGGTVTATMMTDPTGSVSNDLRLALLNNATFDVTIGGTRRFAVDTNGDVTGLRNLTASGNGTFTNGISASPSGLGVSSSLTLYGLSGTSNSGWGQVAYFDANGLRFTTGANGTGTVRGMEFSPGGTLNLRMGADTVGLYGVTPVARQTVSAAATDPATTMALVNELRALLIALGPAQ